MSSLGLHAQPATRHNHGQQSDQLVPDLIKILITQRSQGKARGEWEAIVGSTGMQRDNIEIGIGNRSGNPAIATANHHIEMQGTNLVILDKTHQYAAITNANDKMGILNNILSQVPEKDLIEAHIKWLLSQLQRGNSMTANAALPLENACSNSQILSVGGMPRGTWQFGRNGSNTFYVANANFQIEVDTGGRLSVRGKDTNSTAYLASQPVAAVDIMRSLSDCFPHVTEAMLAVNRSTQQTTLRRQ